ncbi:MAG: hypothetical protein PHW76_09305, partial [Alphaproteobacteria bacterium]|nr:hypothetical protein [Alphaproteobacteria bacterium]
MFEEYATKQLSQNRSGKEVKQIFQREFLPKFRDRAIDSIERNEISREVNRIAERAPYAGNRALSHIKTFFRWAIGEGCLQGDPTAVMQKPFKGEIKRDRVL